MWWSKKKTKPIVQPDWIQKIQAKLHELRHADPKLELFGVTGHGYKLGPPLTEEELLAAEKHYRIQLPTDFREFLLYLGNGGAGPGYGMQRFGVLTSPVGIPYQDITVRFKLSLEAQNSNHYACGMRDTFFREMDRLLNDPTDLARPFPLTKGWKYDENETPDDNVEYMKWSREVRDPIFEHGSFELADLGCGQKQKLIITGAEAGRIWNFDADNPIVNVWPSIGGYDSEEIPRSASFVEWYDDWLTHYLYLASKLSR
jgi:hypothetical protein